MKPYISGQVPVDEMGTIIGIGDINKQSMQVFENIKIALETVGLNFKDVIKLTFFLTDISQMGSVRSVRDNYIDLDNPPCSSAMEVKRLVN